MLDIVKLIQDNRGTISSSFGQILALLAVFGISVDLMPWIHVNPVKAIFKYIGNIIGKYISGIVDKSLDGVRIELDKQNNQIRNVAHGLLDMSDRFDKKELEDIRWEILDFGNNIRCGENYYKEAWDHIISQHDYYEKVIETKGLENGKMDMTYEYIMKRYREHMENNDFV